MNAHDEALKIPPPPECESCPHDRREKGGDGRMRYWCASAMPRHPGCGLHPDNGQIHRTVSSGPR